MNKEFFKPTKGKIITTIIITLILSLWFFIYNKVMDCLCPIGKDSNNCFDFSFLSIFMSSSCKNCGCTSLLEIIRQYTFYIIIPFITIYLISSIIILIVRKIKSKKQKTR